jgi:hypothetical protein
VCLSCGCHFPNKNHGDHRHITLEDLKSAADASNISVVDAVHNIADTVADLIANHVPEDK